MSHENEIRAEATLALRLIETQRTLVLATADPGPWPAPVYYVYRNQSFYFFSSPRSRHIIAALTTNCCAGAIYRDSDNWRDIEGLQMEGRLKAVQPGIEAVAVLASYVKKFPTVKDLFGDEEFEFHHFIERFRTRLYAFAPQRVWYLNNQAGFGKRREIQF